MTSADSTNKPLPSATIAWEQLSERVDAMAAAWQSDGEPPELAQFLPAEPVAFRRLILVELIKVDLEYRWQHRGLPKTIEEYLEDFPELAADGVVPCDLIHEEFHVRKQTGDVQKPQAYYQRFPRQADQLRRLLELESADVTTTLVHGDRGQEIEVGQQVDDFDLLTRLGKGAFASVFLARQRSMQRLVALKVSRDRGSEPQTLAQLDHPHIVRVYDQRLLPERHLRLMYMQHIPGGTLLTVVDIVRATSPFRRSGKMLLEAVDQALTRQGDSPPTDSSLRRKLAACTWPEAVGWFGARIASRLDYAHQRGVLHRDVKPANVLLAADGAPKLADFNVSFASKLQGATAADFFGGSLAYMSPEELEASDPDHARQPDELDGRSDIYSLGIMLWELLTGHRPFEDEMFQGDILKTRRQMLERRMQGVDAATRARLPHDLCAGMDQVLLAALRATADGRPQSAARLARQLELCQQAHVQRLLRPKPGSLRQWLRRYPIWTLILATVLPNIVFSVLNIGYNVAAIVNYLGNARDFFLKVMLITVNSAAYSSGVSVGTILAWPVLKAVRGLLRGQTIAPAELEKLRARGLRLGDYLFWIAAFLWTVTGLVFPAWLYLRMGDSQVLEARYFWHFFLSQLLCGLISATQTFFCVTLVSVRGFCPLLVQPDSPQPGDVGPLARLDRRLWIFFGLSVAAVPLALMLLGLIGSDFKLAVIMSCLVGLVGIYLAFRMLRAIQHDLAALAAALDPSHESDAGADTVESFWTGTR